MPSSRRIMSPIRTLSAWPVPPAALMGPAKSMDRNSDPSALFMMRTLPMPSSGATRIASVSTPRPTLSPESMASVMSLFLAYILRATSRAISIAAVSLSVVSRRLRKSSSILIPSRYSSSSFSVLLARSVVRGISTSSEKSRPLALASSAMRKTSSARRSNQL